jgi:hypothetical protein
LKAVSRCEGLRPTAFCSLEGQYSQQSSLVKEVSTELSLFPAFIVDMVGSSAYIVPPTVKPFNWIDTSREKAA